MRHGEMRPPDEINSRWGQGAGKEQAASRSTRARVPRARSPRERTFKVVSRRHRSWSRVFPPRAGPHLILQVEQDATDFPDGHVADSQRLALVSARCGRAALAKWRY